MSWLHRALQWMIRESGKAPAKPHRITMDVYLRARIEEDSHEGYTPLETLKWELDFMRMYDQASRDIYTQAKKRRESL